MNTIPIQPEESVAPDERLEDKVAAHSERIVRVETKVETIETKMDSVDNRLATLVKIGIAALVGLVMNLVQSFVASSGIVP